MKSYRLAYTDSLAAAFRPRGAPARWNSEGVVMVYSSEHVALAALEILASWGVYANLQGYHLYCATVDDAHSREATTDLDIRDLSATRAYGDAWVQRAKSVALKVPSVMGPYSYNYLLNPNHPSFHEAVRLEHLGSFIFDLRIEALLASAKS